MLPRNPLFTQRKLGVFRERQLMLRIKMSCQVRQNRRSLHYAQATVVVIDKDGNPAIGAFLREPRLFLNILANVDRLIDIVRLPIRLFQFFEDDARFVTCSSLTVSLLSHLQYQTLKQLTIGRPKRQQLQPLVGNTLIRSFLRHRIVPL